MVVPDIPDDDSPEVIDWIQTYMEWMDGNPEYSRGLSSRLNTSRTHEGVPKGKRRLASL